MGDYICYIAAWLTYSSCYDCFNLPCCCLSFRDDMQACINALEMGY